MKFRSKEVWVDQDGTEHYPNTLRTSHIVNIINFMRRKIHSGGVLGPLSRIDEIAIEERPVFGKILFVATKRGVKVNENPVTMPNFNGAYEALAFLTNRKVKANIHIPMGDRLRPGRYDVIIRDVKFDRTKQEFSFDFVLMTLGPVEDVYEQYADKYNVTRDEAKRRMHASNYGAMGGAVMGEEEKRRQFDREHIRMWSDGKGGLTPAQGAGFQATDTFSTTFTKMRGLEQAVERQASVIASLEGQVRSLQTQVHGHKETELTLFRHYEQMEKRTAETVARVKVDRYDFDMFSAHIMSQLRSLNDRTEQVSQLSEVVQSLAKPTKKKVIKKKVVKKAKRK